MARPRRRTRPTLSLFPFLSVLACVIGTLVLVITATATSQVAAGGIDFERYERLEEEIETSRRRLAELSGLARELEELESNLANARERAGTLERETLALREALAENAPLRDALARQQAELARLEAELAPLVAASDREKQKLAERRRKLGSARIRLRPAGSGYGLDPHFVECRPEGIVVYEGIERRPLPIATHRIASSAEYRRFLRAALFRTNATVIFLIRQGGVDACEWARGVARRHRIRHGEIPLTSDGPLDFSAVNGA